MSHKGQSSRNRIAVILASASPRRQEILKDLGIPFKVRISTVPERWANAADPHRIVRRLAKEKAESCNDADALVIGMDTLVVLGSQKLGKPLDAIDAAAMLRLLSGRTHRVISGVAIFYHGKTIVDSELSRVYFRKLSANEIDWYISTGEPFDKAGAYAIQGLGRIFIRKIEGGYYNVVGFPLDAFQRVLKKFGLSIFDLMS